MVFTNFSNTHLNLTGNNQNMYHTLLQKFGYTELYYSVFYSSLVQILPMAIFVHQRRIQSAFVKLLNLSENRALSK